MDRAANERPSCGAVCERKGGSKRDGLGRAQRRSHEEAAFVVLKIYPFVQHILPAHLTSYKARARSYRILWRKVIRVESYQLLFGSLTHHFDVYM